MDDTHLLYHCNEIWSFCREMGTSLDSERAVEGVRQLVAAAIAAEANRNEKLRHTEKKLRKEIRVLKRQVGEAVKDNDDLVREVGWLEQQIELYKGKADHGRSREVGADKVSRGRSTVESEVPESRARAPGN